jgi:hypothetical protein
MNAFISMPEARRRLICEQAGAQKGLFESSVEKDFWVCWILERLFSLPDIGGGLTFKGGTSLSKGWKLIERFSEDIDIVIDRSLLGFSGDRAPEVAPSNKQTKKCLESLGETAQAFVLETLQAALHIAIKVDMPTDLGWSLVPDTADPQNQSLLFRYPTVFPDHPEYLSQVVKIEMGARSDTDPSSIVEIQPIIAEAFPEVFPASKFMVRSVQPIRTFWEKAMLLHEETYRPGNKTRRKRGMARHYYDLFQLIRKGVAQDAAADRELFNRIRDHRRVYFKYTWLNYETLAPGQLRIVPLEEQTADWMSDYTSMQQEMFYGDVPDFKTVLATVKAFEDRFNSAP